MMILDSGLLFLGHPVYLQFIYSIYIYIIYTYNQSP